jgi:transcriptional regulator GlxA family with amidase domain
MTKSPTFATEIGLLAYPGVQLAALHGLTDLFQIADKLASRLGGEGDESDAAGLRVTHWQPNAAGDKLAVVFDTHPQLATRPSFLIVPPSLSERVEPAMAAKLARWLTERHADGATLCSICAGAFLLAETGLLDGRAATTHWSCGEEFSRQFPTVRVDVDKLIIDDGDVISAGGLMAWADLGLKLVDRLLGPTVTVQTARFLLIDPIGREQRHYSNFSPRLNHGDAAILKVQHWLQNKGAKDVSLEAMAGQAGLEQRTFLRRFQAATGLKPTEYCQHVRVGKAREALEFTKRSIDQIAWQAGYADPGAFRKVFQKIVGLSPGDYRRRFGVGA